MELQQGKEALQTVLGNSICAKGWAVPFLVPHVKMSSQQTKDLNRAETMELRISLLIKGNRVETNSEEKIFASHVSDKSLTSGMHKEQIA